MFVNEKSTFFFSGNNFHYPGENNYYRDSSRVIVVVKLVLKPDLLFVIMLKLNNFAFARYFSHYTRLLLRRPENHSGNGYCSHITHY